MQPALLSRFTQPSDKLRHALGRIERRGRLEHDADHLAVGIEGTDIIAERFVSATVPLVLVAVSEQVAVKLLDKVFQ